MEGRADFAVASAGVSAGAGMPPSWQSVEALRECGIDITPQRSQPLTDALVARATHIFVMTRGHFETLRQFFPEADGKTYLVGSFIPDQAGSADVPDPYGSSLSVYRECRDTLKKAIPGILRFIDPSAMNTPAPARPLRIAIGSDHAGLELKVAVHSFLSKKGEVVTDVGTQTKDSVDYNDFAERVSQEVIAGRADLGVLMCSSPAPTTFISIARLTST